MASRRGYVNPTSIYGANINNDGNLGRFEVVRTKSVVDATKGKWFVSLRDGQDKWWHSHSDYTEKQAIVLCDFFYGLDDEVLAAILESKLQRQLIRLAGVAKD